MFSEFLKQKRNPSVSTFTVILCQRKLLTDFAQHTILNAVLQLKNGCTLLYLSPALQFLAFFDNKRVIPSITYGIDGCEFFLYMQNSTVH